MPFESPEQGLRQLIASGTATGVSPTNLSDSGKSWANGQWVGATVTMGGDTLLITSNSPNVLTGSGGWTPATPGTGFYSISGTQVGESPEALYAKYFGVTHGDTLLENLVRTKLTSGGHSANIEESVEASVRKGGGTGEAQEEELAKTGLTGWS